MILSEISLRLLRKSIVFFQKILQKLNCSGNLSMDAFTIFFIFKKSCVNWKFFKGNFSKISPGTPLEIVLDTYLFFFFRKSSIFSEISPGFSSENSKMVPSIFFQEFTKYSFSNNFGIYFQYISMLKKILQRFLFPLGVPLQSFPGFLLGNLPIDYFMNFHMGFIVKFTKHYVRKSC